MALDRDAYFTPPETCEVLVKEIIEKIPNALNYTWVEPSAGSGNFLEAAKNAGVKNYEAYDIHPFHSEVEKIDDFLTEDLDLTGKLVFGNPPYGYRNKLSIAFVNRAFEIGAEYVAFYLPASMGNVKPLNKMPLAELSHFEQYASIFVNEKGEQVRKLYYRLALCIYKRSSSPINYSIEKYVTRVSKEEANVFLVSNKIFYNFDLSKLNGTPEKYSIYNYYSNNRKLEVFSLFVKDLELFKKSEKDILALGSRIVAGKASVQDINWLLYCNSVQFIKKSLTLL
jgi:predicted RNA methylase